MKHMLSENKFDIIGLTETRRNKDSPVFEIPHNFKWLGKDRTSNKGGGIGFFVNIKTVSIDNDNLLNSQSDPLEILD